MQKMLIASTILSLLAALCRAQASPGLGPVFQDQAQTASQARGTGDLEGTVTDATGAVVPGATVSVKTRGVAPKVAVTDGQGKFHIVGLTAGPQEISVTMPGFADFKSQNFNLVAGQSNELNIQLEVASTSTNI